MKRVFFETPLFTRLLPKYLDNQEYRALQLALLENPQMGELMQQAAALIMMVRKFPDTLEKLLSLNNNHKVA